MERPGLIVLLSQSWQLIGNVLGRAASAKLGRSRSRTLCQRTLSSGFLASCSWSAVRQVCRVSDVWGNRAVVRSALTSQCPSS